MLCSIKTVVYGIIYILGSIQFGFLLNYGSISIEGLKKNYPNWDFNKDDKKIRFYNNFQSLFGSLGGFIIRYLVYLTSGKKAIFIFGLLNLIIWFLYFILKPSLLILGIVLRCLHGVIIGGFACIIPVYLTNMCPEETVGFFGCLNQLGIVLGMLIFSLVGSFIDFKIVAVIGAVFDIIFCGVIWLVPNEKNEKDKESLYQRQHVPKIFIAVMLMIFQQFSGMNAILNNIDTIMLNTNISRDTNIQSALVEIAQLISVLVACFTMDVFGRKKLWLISSVGIIISLLLYIFSLYKTFLGYFQATVVFLLMLSFGQGYGPIPWFICHDLFPKPARLDAQMYITFGNMIASYAVVSLYPVMNRKLNDITTILIYACITVFAIPFGAVFIPKKTENRDEDLTLI